MEMISSTVELSFQAINMLQSLLLFLCHKDDAIKFAVLAQVKEFPNMHDLKFSK